jgi:hypothetical protein
MVQPFRHFQRQCALWPKRTSTEPSVLSRTPIIDIPDRSYARRPSLFLRDAMTTLRSYSGARAADRCNAQGCSRRQSRLYQLLCMSTGVPSDQFGTATKNTSIEGSPFSCGCSVAEKDQ